MKNQDYVWLDSICTQVEQVYGLRGSDELGELSFRKLVPALQPKIAEYNPVQLEKLNTRISDSMFKLSYLTARSRFLGSKNLSFDKLPKLSEVREALACFSEKKHLNKESRKKSNAVAAIIAYIDDMAITNNPDPYFNDLRYNGLEYRYLRMFILVVLHHGYLEASIVAQYLLLQMEGVNNNVPTTTPVNR